MKEKFESLVSVVKKNKAVVSLVSFLVVAGLVWGLAAWANGSENEKKTDTKVADVAKKKAKNSDKKQSDSATADSEVGQADTNATTDTTDAAATSQADSSTTTTAAPSTSTTTSTATASTATAPKTSTSTKPTAPTTSPSTTTTAPVPTPTVDPYTVTPPSSSGMFTALRSRWQQTFPTDRRIGVSDIDSTFVSLTQQYVTGAIGKDQLVSQMKAQQWRANNLIYSLWSVTPGLFTTSSTNVAEIHHEVSVHGLLLGGAFYDVEFYWNASTKQTTVAVVSGQIQSVAIPPGQ